MKTIKCYHVRRIKLVVEESSTRDYQLFYQGYISAPLIATIYSKRENVEDIWDCCNNSCWWDGDEDFSAMQDYRGRFRVKFTKDYFGYCNDDLIIHMGDKFYISKSVGWTACDTLEEAIDYCSKNSFWCRLYCKDYQHPDGREHSLEELLKIKEQYEKYCGSDCCYIY